MKIKENKSVQSTILDLEPDLPLLCQKIQIELDTSSSSPKISSRVQIDYQKALMSITNALLLKYLGFLWCCDLHIYLPTKFCQCKNILSPSRGLQLLAPSCARPPKFQLVNERNHGFGFETEETKVVSVSTETNFGFLLTETH